MKDLAILMLFLFSLPAFCSGESISANEKIDSIYATLTNIQKFGQLIWQEQTSDTNETSLDYGGVYFNQPSPQIAQFKNRITALQLDNSFHLGGTDYATPQTVSSVTDTSLRIKYYSLLKSHYKSIGYDYIILPVNQANNGLNEIASGLNHFDSTFFIKHEDLVFNPSPKKKSLLALTGANNILVINADHEVQYLKGVRRSAKRVSESQTRIKEILRKRHFPEESQQMSSIDVDHLTIKLIQESISAFVRESAVLPIRSSSIAIYSKNEGFLTHNLKGYAENVYDIRTDEIPFGIPVIIDAREDVIDAAEYALSLQQFNPVIWISKYDELIHVNASAVLLVPQNHHFLDEVLPKMLFGTSAINGITTLPIPGFLSRYQQHSISSLGILGVAKPEHSGMNKIYLDSLEIIAEEMILKQAAPGCQILVAREGNLVYNKSFGYLTYDSLIENHNSIIYDLASITKVMGTALCIMDLYEKGHLQLDSTIAKYLPEYDSTNKENITIKQLLSHNAGIRSYIPFWKRSLKKDLLETFYYQSKKDEDKDLRSYGLKPDQALRDTLNNWIMSSPLLQFDSGVEYMYSDIGFMILHQLIEAVSDMSMEEYLVTNFYEPLRLNHTMFNPLESGVDRYQIAPTEYDFYFRKEQVWGEVHDRNAAVFGGVAGHAGLFSNARDLAVIMQMMLQEGYYGQKQFIDSSTIQTFNKRYFENNRRGLGWDKKTVDHKESFVSNDSFGHLGFSGTMVWADPEYDLVFVFLSNRIFPNSENEKLNELDIRDRMLSFVYKSILWR